MRQGTAVEVLAEELQTKRNPRIAAMVLDKMGVMRPPDIKATSAVAAQREIALERRQRNIELAKRTYEIRSREETTLNEDKVAEDKTAGS